MSDIPFEARRVINALAIEWRNWHKRLPNLVTPYSGMQELIDRCGFSADFFWQVYDDILSGSSSKYADFSESQFREFLETEYRRTVQMFEEYQPRQTPEERRGYIRRARADFEIFGRAHQPSPQLTRSAHSYENHCWNCHQHISSDVQARCPACNGFICSSCGACFCWQ